MILVDTSVLVDFLKGSENEATQRLVDLLKKGMPFGITSFVFQEILQGAKSEQEYAQLKTYLETQRFYHPLDPVESYAKAAMIYFRCRRKGFTVRSSIDCIIAQIAIEHDFFLLHNDSDFDAIASVSPLKVY
jgi:predicted nucleic acid-binding protein